MAGGLFHSLALLEDGRVLSFGSAIYGQLGNGNTDTDELRQNQNRFTPTTVERLTPLGISGVFKMLGLYPKH